MYIYIIYIYIKNRMKSCKLGCSSGTSSPDDSEANNRGLYNAKAVEDVAASVASVQRRQRTSNFRQFMLCIRVYMILYDII